MKKLLSVLIYLVFYKHSVAAEFVNYCEDSIYNSEGETVQLLGGSRWETVGYNFFLIAQDVLVLQGTTQVDGRNYQYGELLSDGNRMIATQLSGTCNFLVGTKHVVVREINDGRSLITDDGTVLNFDSYDSFDTGFWLPPYEVLITSNELYMWNLNEGKRVWLQSIE